MEQRDSYNTDDFFDQEVLLLSITQLFSETVRGVIAVKMPVLYSPRNPVL